MSYADQHRCPHRLQLALRVIGEHFGDIVKVLMTVYSILTTSWAVKLPS